MEKLSEAPPIEAPKQDLPQLAPATLAIHADDVLNTVTDVAPPLHVSTTFRYPKKAEDLVPVGAQEVCQLSVPFDNIQIQLYQTPTP
jgi:hypothetical protein